MLRVTLPVTDAVAPVETRMSFAAIPMYMTLTFSLPSFPLASLAAPAIVPKTVAVSVVRVFPASMETAPLTVIDVIFASPATVRVPSTFALSMVPAFTETAPEKTTGSFSTLKSPVTARAFPDSTEKDTAGVVVLSVAVAGDPAVPLRTMLPAASLIVPWKVWPPVNSIFALARVMLETVSFLASTTTAAGSSTDLPSNETSPTASSAPFSVIFCSSTVDMRGAAFSTVVA